MRTIGVLAAFVLLLYGLHLLGFGPPLPSIGGSGGSRGSASPSPASPTPRSSSPMATPALNTSDPFADSPAELFSNGGTGIVLPTAHALAGYSAAQVAFAYGMTKHLLVAAHLNSPTLLGGPPLAFAGLLTPQQQTYFLRNLGRTGVATNGGAESTRAWVTSFAPRSLVLVGDVIKVHGRMSATTATDRGQRVLRIHVDYLFVYPVQSPGQPATTLRIVVQTIANADFAKWAGRGGPLQPWWLPIGRAVTVGARCDASNGFIIPDFAGQAPALADPYKLAQLPAQTACRIITQP